ncbi:hypothetical protein TCAL_16818 [Tigriopus californicus]|uniref:Uncharacterized protein n=1 Tax=Tigriopus californicus TaxID=6832 RepID=A0A553PB86_TIGCA|nr:hypothetical protein TCAL_16818 [Tigriopus californicus]
MAWHEIDCESFEPVDGSSTLSFNPYPWLGCPKHPCWPRGFPLNLIRETSTHLVKIKKTKVLGNQVAVFQSLADHEPDVDAIHRMVMQTPWVFQKPIAKQSRPLVLPKGQFSPYNAQATLHNRNAFFALYLPISVNGRVSDIWRSYFAQALFRLCNLKIGFMRRPLVVQDRNPHSYEADFEAELPLYRQTDRLITFLDEWSSSPQDKLAQHPMEY